VSMSDGVCVDVDAKASAHMMHSQESCGHLNPVTVTDFQEDPPPLPML